MREKQDLVGGQESCRAELRLKVVKTSVPSEKEHR